MRKCTWSGCKRAGKHSRVASNGAEWAHLCDEHNTRLDSDLACSDPRKWLGAWTRAGREHPARKHLRETAAKGAAGIVELARQGHFGKKR